jgi:hypothetical protein
MKLEFIPDQDAELVMNRLGIKYSIERSPLSAVDREWSHQNEARMHAPLNQSHVEELAQYARMRNPFKRSVCVRKKVLKKGDKEEIGILGGNHRDAAYVKAEVTEFEYYLIDTEGLTEFEWSTALPRLLNCLPFMPLDHESKVQTALWWEEMNFMGFKESAEKLGLKYDYLCQRKKQHSIITLLENAKVPNTSRFRNETTFVPFGSLVLDSVVLAATCLAIKADYTKAECQALANALKKVAKDEATQLGYIKKLEEKLALDKTDVKAPASQPQVLRTKWIKNFHAAYDMMQGKAKLVQLGVTKDYQHYDALIKELNGMARLCRLLAQNLSV